MNRNMRNLGILVLMLIIASQGVLGQVSVDSPSSYEEGRQVCGADSQGNIVIEECRDSEFVIIEVCSDSEVCDVKSNGELFCNRGLEGRMVGVEENDFLNTNYLLIGVIILLIILIVLVIRLKRK